MKKKTIFLILAVIALNLMFVGCSQKQKEFNKKNVPESQQIPEEISSIANIDGDLSSDTVLVNTQGGPMYELDTTTVKEMVSQSFSTDNLIIVNVHQVQTLDSAKFQKDITFEQAKAYDTESVAMLAEVIKYFKGQNKKVYVMGMSFGAWMVQDLIAENGVDIADKYLIANGRVDMPEVIWTSFSEGGSGYFKNGKEPIVNENGTMEEPASQSTSNQTSSAKNISKLAAGLGHKRYSELLSKYDLSNVIYLYGKTDEPVGSLTEDEVNFLKEKKVQVIGYNGGHDAPVDVMNKGFKFIGLTKK